MKGWWNMACWNGLSPDQQERLLRVGVLPWGYEPRGECPNGAEVEVTTMWDEAPGPRFYCAECAVGYVTKVRDEQARAALDEAPPPSGNTR